jgi:predicted acyltransferase
MIFALLVGFQLVAHVRTPMSRALDAAGWLIWTVRVPDLTVKLAVTLLAEHCQVARPRILYQVVNVTGIARYVLKVLHLQDLLCSPAS